MLLNIFNSFVKKHFNFQNMIPWDSGRRWRPVGRQVVAKEEQVTSRLYTELKDKIPERVRK